MLFKKQEFSYRWRAPGFAPNLDTLPPDARCLLLVIDGNNYTFAVEPCTKSRYALCCKYALLKHIYLRVLVSLFIKKTR
jgi:hypothetical protein